jgi:hypothetical protein
VISKDLYTEESGFTFFKMVDMKIMNSKQKQKEFKSTQKVIDFKTIYFIIILFHFVFVRTLNQRI